VVYVKTLDYVDSLSHTNIKSKLFAAGARGVARIIGATWSYLLMLIVMSFNVGLFLAVVFGLGVGSAIFGSHHSTSTKLRIAELQNAELCC
jgi:hypothetical protein